MLETSVRLLRLLSLLLARRDWSGAELADRLEVTTRTVRNDMERLRILGYEIRSRPGTAGGYRVDAGNHLPPLLLDDDEAVAVAVGLRAAAAGSVSGIEETSVSALAKLERTLPARLRPRIDALRTATVTAARGGPTVDAAVLGVLANAARHHERLRFSYSSKTRSVEPHRLVYTGRRWYLLAWDLDRDDWRNFRADRITDPVAGSRFKPREMPDAEAAERVLRGAGSLAWRHQARVRLHAPLEVVSVKVPPAAGLLTRVDETTCELQTGGDSLVELANYIARLDLDFSVVEPPELRATFRSLAKRFRNS